jgi:hypothetical protein
MPSNLRIRFGISVGVFDIIANQEVHEPLREKQRYWPE